MSRVYRKSQGAAAQLRSIKAAVVQLVRLTEDDGPLEYCGWRHSVREEAASLADGLTKLIAEAADDEST